MKIRLLLVTLALLISTGCSPLSRLLCIPDCGSDQQTSSSLVEFLYPVGSRIPRANTVPELRLPLRVGLAFLPMQKDAGNSGLDAARKEQLLQRIQRRFADRSFVANIVVIPDYYLADRASYGGLAGVQRLYGVDVMALVSYDQEIHLDENEWSLSYLTIVGAYVVKGNRHDVSTLVDLAVVEPSTSSLVLRAGGVDTRSGNTTLRAQQRETRESSGAAFDAATGRMIENFDAALTRFEEEVRAGKAPVRVVRRDNAGGGGGAFDVWSLITLAALSAVQRVSHAWRARH